MIRPGQDTVDEIKADGHLDVNMTWDVVAYPPSFTNSLSLGLRIQIQVSPKIIGQTQERYEFGGMFSAGSPNETWPLRTRTALTVLGRSVI